VTALERNLNNKLR